MRERSLLDLLLTERMARKLRWRASMFGLLSVYVMAIMFLCEHAPPDSTLNPNSERGRWHQCELWRHEQAVAALAEERPWLHRGDTQCLPAQSLAFLKIHKCASTSIQNILMRYGESHGLLFALPKKRHLFPYTRLFNSSFVMSEEPFHTDRPLNIFAVHAIWNRQEIVKIMQPGMVSFTMVREPSDLFLSLYDYFALDTIHEFPVDQYIMRNKMDAKKLMGCIGYNVMACDMGAQPGDYEDKKAIQILTYRMDLEFDLVMVAERFEESMVLLGHLLCWSYEDLVSYSVNSRVKRFKDFQPQVLSMLKKRLRPDYYIYNYFIEKFDMTVKAFGEERMAAEVAKLRSITETVIANCAIYMTEPEDKGDGVKIPGVSNVAVATTNSTSHECQSLVRPEQHYVYRVKQLQEQRLRAMEQGDSNSR